MRDFDAEATLELGPDKLKVRLHGRCTRDISGRVICWLSDVKLDGRSVFERVPQDKLPGLTREFESAYLGSCMRGRESETDGWQPDGAA